MYQIASRQQRKKLHEQYGSQGGVYILHCLDVDDEKTPILIQRVLGVDKEGVLYIGKTAPGLGRIGDLVKSISPDYKSLGHHVGLRFSKNKKLAMAFPFEQLHVSFRQADDPAVLESELIQEYFQKYGEVPPLNANEP